MIKEVNGQKFNLLYFKEGGVRKVDVRREVPWLSYSNNNLEIHRARFLANDEASIQSWMEFYSNLKYSMETAPVQPNPPVEFYGIVLDRIETTIYPFGISISSVRFCGNQITVVVDFKEYEVEIIAHCLDYRVIGSIGYVKEFKYYLHQSFFDILELEFELLTVLTKLQAKKDQPEKK